MLLIIPQRYKFSSKSQREYKLVQRTNGCWLYHKGTNFRANHNMLSTIKTSSIVVDYTTKVQIFEQITTTFGLNKCSHVLLIIPQRYKFSSKSQPQFVDIRHDGSCWLYHKGTNFRANHNVFCSVSLCVVVVDYTTKVQIFEQITTNLYKYLYPFLLLIIPQRYKFSSKSQHTTIINHKGYGCWLYHKGTNFRANHNISNN